jgi:hypothetical protein
VPSPQPVNLGGFSCICTGVLCAVDRSLKGIFYDKNQNPLNGAIVQIENVRTHWIRSYLTLENGSYQFQGLDPDVEYKVRAIYDGASSPVKTLSRFDEKEIAEIDLYIEPE